MHGEGNLRYRPAPLDKPLETFSCFCTFYLDFVFFLKEGAYSIYQIETIRFLNLLVHNNPLFHDPRLSCRKRCASEPDPSLPD